MKKEGVLIISSSSSSSRQNNTAKMVRNECSCRVKEITLWNIT